MTSLPALLGQGFVLQAGNLYALSTHPHPYFQLTHAWLLYVITPLVALSSFILFLAPGGILVLAIGKARTAAEWIVLAFGSSIAIVVVLSTFTKLVFGPINRPILLTVWLAATSLVWLFAAIRLRRSGFLPFPVSNWVDIRRLLWMCGAAIIGTAALTPKIFWENFNLDGIEAFEFGRSLTTHLLPFWDLQDGVFGFYHNFMLFAYPNHWFITLFGPIEASVRLPFILYLLILFAAVILLIEVRSNRPLSALEEAVIWLGLAAYTVVQTFNTNYEPFFADLAENAATDTLVIALFLSACYALWRNWTAVFWVLAFMSCLAGPGSLLLFGSLAIMTLLVRPENWQSAFKATVLFIVVWVAAGLMYEVFYNRLLLHGVNNQFSAKNMLRRLYPPTLTQFVRFSAIIFPSGILPLLSFVALRRRDRLSLVVAGVTLIYFAVIYMQAWTSLHQFTPVMILPLIVFWRVYVRAGAQTQRWLLPSIAISTVLCCYISLPQHYQINQAIREFGQATDYRIGDYEHDYETAARGASSIAALLPEGYRMDYPNQPWGSDPYSWLYYATRPKTGSTRINYIVQPATESAPIATTQVMNRNGVSVHVRDLAAWRNDRDRKVPKVVVSRVYEPILRHTYQFFRTYVEHLNRKNGIARRRD